MIYINDPKIFLQYSTVILVEKLLYAAHTMAINALLQTFTALATVRVVNYFALLY